MRTRVYRPFFLLKLLLGENKGLQWNTHLWHMKMYSTVPRKRLDENFAMIQTFAHISGTESTTVFITLDKIKTIYDMSTMKITILNVALSVLH